MGGAVIVHGVVMGDCSSIRKWYTNIHCLPCSCGAQRWPTFNKSEGRWALHMMVVLASVLVAIDRVLLCAICSRFCAQYAGLCIMLGHAYPHSASFCVIEQKI